MGFKIQAKRQLPNKPFLQSKYKAKLNQESLPTQTNSIYYQSNGFNNLNELKDQKLVDLTTAPRKDQTMYNYGWNDQTKSNPNTKNRVSLIVQNQLNLEVNNQTLAS